MYRGHNSLLYVSLGHVFWSDSRLPKTVGSLQVEDLVSKLYRLFAQICEILLDSWEESIEIDGTLVWVPSVRCKEDWLLTLS